ncbi:MAG: hypothetical protein B7Z10_04805 [Rhodobacterales bacterium 32-66-7]|nr:MAG: hypothetical protein B7Z31_10340 [Rhodobacterales bacterium 12-65-15]OYX25910.1 MAG: hypothetical protein B7Z10_04805 [Rhodobacterales bacterium 32-66-7]
MAKGSPSLIALLGVLAVAGYQNRDRLGEMLRSQSDTTGDGTARTDQSSSGGGLMDSLRQMAGGAGAGGLMGGLSEMVERFTGSPQRAKAESWIGTGQNEAIGPDEMEQALDEDTIAELVEKTGLSRSELLSRLSQTLPDAVDQATPDGEFPVSLQEPRSI